MIALGKSFVAAFLVAAIRRPFADFSQEVAALSIFTPHEQTKADKNLT